MIRIEGSERVEDFGRLDVFRAGTQTSNWPHEDGLIIKPHDEIVVPGTRIDVGLSMLDIHVDGEVTRYEEGGLLLIEGESKLLRASVRIGLSDAKNAAPTDIQYEVQVAGKSLPIKLAEVAVHKFLNQAIPSFARAYRQNVTDSLQAEAMVSRS